MSYATKQMRLKMQNREVSERRQVGDAEEMLSANDETKGAWWRDVGMDEGL
jgi:pyruvate dehydrogenase kinase 2/3/4